jgi:hypothetical protein
MQFGDACAWFSERLKNEGNTNDHVQFMKQVHSCRRYADARTYTCVHLGPWKMVLLEKLIFS